MDARQTADLTERLTQARDALRAAQLARQCFTEQADEYKALSAEQETVGARLRCMDVCIQQRARAIAAGRDVSEQLALIAELEYRLTAPVVALTSEQVAGMDECAGLAV